MAPVAFIHSIGNKPEPRVVLAQWRATVPGLDSVIADDLLTPLDGTPRVDALLTVDSAIGISGVQDKVSPPWSRDDGRPTNRPGDRPWSTVYDLPDSVCDRFDRRTAGDFLNAGASRVTDTSATHVGSRRHSIANHRDPDRRPAVPREIFG